MALETGTYVNDLVATNPVGATDDIAQGDDHLRLIKSILRNTFVDKQTGNPYAEIHNLYHHTDYKRIEARSAVSHGDGTSYTVVDTAFDSEAKAFHLDVSGALNADRELILPSREGRWVVENATTGGFGLHAKTAAGGGVWIPNGRAAFLRSDGTNVTNAFDLFEEAIYIGSTDTDVAFSLTRGTGANGNVTYANPGTGFHTFQRAGANRLVLGGTETRVYGATTETQNVYIGYDRSGDGEGNIHFISAASNTIGMTLERRAGASGLGFLTNVAGNLYLETTGAGNDVVLRPIGTNRLAAGATYVRQYGDATEDQDLWVGYNRTGDGTTRLRMVNAAANYEGFRIGRAGGTAGSTSITQYGTGALSFVADGDGLIRFYGATSVERLQVASTVIRNFTGVEEVREASAGGDVSVRIGYNRGASGLSRLDLYSDGAAPTATSAYLHRAAGATNGLSLVNQSGEILIHSANDGQLRFRGTVDRLLMTNTTAIFYLPTLDVREKAASDTCNVRVGYNRAGSAASQMTLFTEATTPLVATAFIQKLAGTAGNFTIKNEDGTMIIDNDGNADIFMRNNNGSARIVIRAGGDIEFRANDGATQTARIDDGRLLTSTVTAYDSGGVTGTGASDQWSAGSDGSVVQQRANVNRYTTKPNVTTSQILDIFRVNNTNVGQISTDGTNTTYSTSSARELKDQIRPLESVMDIEGAVRAVPAYEFEFKSNPGKKMHGVIADEVKAVLPEAVIDGQVDDDGNPIPAGVDYGKLAPLALAGVKQLYDRIAALVARIEALEAA